MSGGSRTRVRRSNAQSLGFIGLLSLWLPGSRGFSIGFSPGHEGLLPRGGISHTGAAACAAAASAEGRGCAEGFGARISGRTGGWGILNRLGGMQARGLREAAGRGTGQGAVALSMQTQARGGMASLPGGGGPAWMMTELLTDGDVTSEDGRMAARNSIIELEQLRNSPFDPSFFSLCVSGDWDLLYSTSRIATPDPAVKIRSIKASIDGDNMKLTHSIEWEFREEADKDKGLPVKETRGMFDVKMKYNFSEVPSVPTRMMIEIEEMRLTCTPVKETPRDPQALITAIQRAVPKEFFDPDESLMDTTYLDPNVRIVCFLGMRFAGVRHVYKRRDMGELTSALSEESEEAYDASGGEAPDWLISDD